VSEYALGTYGEAWRTGADAVEARRIFERFREAGGCFLDTSDNYQQGGAEELLADFLATDRDHVVLATKFGRGAGEAPHLSVAGNSRRAMVYSVEASLRRLKTDRIDLYWAHYDDRSTPIEEIVHAFDDLIASGKVLYAGLSNFPAWRVARGQTVAELRGLAPIAGVQVEHSLVERTAERELLPMAEALGLGAALYSPLGGGVLTGKYRGSNTQSRRDAEVLYREDTPAKVATVDAVVEIAAEVGAPAAAAAVAWQREYARRSTTSMVTVVGPRTAEQLDEYLAALDLRLGEAQFERLNQASAIELGVPHESIAGPPSFGDEKRLAARIVPVS
jgi:aryl-alcohol dehydrogenase-like predicted oxidoreductase